MKIQSNAGSIIDLGHERAFIQSSPIRSNSDRLCLALLDALEGALSVEPGAGVGWTWDDAIRNVRQAAGVVEES